MINENQIFLNQSFTNQDEVFQFLAKTAYAQGLAANEADVYQALKSRENEGTTGMMDGFAIPHAKSESIFKPAIVIVKLAQGMDWDSLDGKPTQYIISMYIPNSEAGAGHLKILSQVAKMLMKNSFKEAFIAAITAQEIADLMQEKLEENEI